MFFYLRNVKGHPWNHKRVYRIDCELSLNLRIKPHKRLKREKPSPLTVPQNIHQCWSMDFMHDQLADGRRCRLFNGEENQNRFVVIMNLNILVINYRVGLKKMK